MAWDSDILNFGDSMDNKNYLVYLLIGVVFLIIYIFLKWFGVL